MPQESKGSQKCSSASELDEAPCMQYRRCREKCQRHSVEHRSGGFCVVVTLDVKNAFKWANWGRIYLALKDRIPEYLLGVASSYLEDRVLPVETEDGTSEVKISAGVAQGSVKAHTM